MSFKSSPGLRLKVFLPLLGLLVISLIGYTLMRGHDAKETRTIRSEPKQIALQKQTRSTSVDIPDKKSPSALEEKTPVKKADEETASKPGKEPENRDAVEHGKLYARVKEARDLRQSPTRESMNRLVQLLQDGSADAVIETAVDSLGHIAHQNSKLKNEILQILSEKALADNFPKQAYALITAAILGKEKSLTLVSKYISKGGEGRDISAVRALSLINSPDSIPLLQSVLENTGDDEARRNCFNVLAKINTPEAFNLLMDRTAASTGEDQAAGVMALARLNKSEANQMLAALVEKDRLGEQALRVLAVSPAGPEIFSGLLVDEKFGQDQKVSLLKRIRDNSYYAPGKTRGKMILALTPFLESADKKIQMETLKTIGHIGGGEDFTGELLIPKLKSKDPDIRRTALSSFRPYANPWNYKELSDLIFDADEQTRKIAMFACEQFFNETDQETLERAAQSDDAFISERAKKILDQLNPA